MTPLNHIPIPELYVSSEAAGKLAGEAAKLPRWFLSARQCGDLELLMNGGFFPLRGFMTQADCDNVMREGKLVSGAAWPLPVTLNVDNDFANRIEPGDDIGLWEGQDLLAIMSVTDSWQSDGEAYLGGKVKGLRPPANAGDTPNQWRGIFRQNGWTDVTALFDADGLIDVTGPALLIVSGTDQGDDPDALVRDETCTARISLFIPAGNGNEDLAALRKIIAENLGATRVRL